LGKRHSADKVLEVLAGLKLGRIARIAEIAKN
jgi:hypothetical protein